MSLAREEGDVASGTFESVESGSSSKEEEIEEDFHELTDKAAVKGERKESCQKVVMRNNPGRRTKKKEAGWKPTGPVNRYGSSEEGLETEGYADGPAPAWLSAEFEERELESEMELVNKNDSEWVESEMEQGRRGEGRKDGARP